MNIPTEIKLSQKKREVTIRFADHTEVTLPCAYLRQHSPSAANNPENTHNDVNIIGIEPVGNYAVQFIFDDGHTTGLYHWQLLNDLAKNYKNRI